MYKVVITFLALAAGWCSVHGCLQNEFFNQEKGRCQQCSECVDTLRLRLCSGTNDTLCGRTLKLDFAYQTNTEQKAPETATPAVLVDDEERYWKNLAFALIALLSVLVIVTTVIVLVTCYRFRKSGWFCKVVTQEQDDAENGYVVIHGFIPEPEIANPADASGFSPHTSPDLAQTKQTRRYRPYRPKRRLMNEFVDDVFESDDSSGSRTLRLPLETIPERSECS